MQKVIVTWEDLRSEIRRLFTHEGLGEDLSSRFAIFMDEEVHDPAVVSIWSQIESDRRCGDNEPLTVMDLDCGLEEVVACLVDWNNNPWNFPPRCAPEKLDFDEVCCKVLKVAGLEIFTQLLDGEGPLKCLCGQITRTRICKAEDIRSAIWGGTAGCGPRQICPNCGRQLTSETTVAVSVEEYKASRR